MKIKLAKSELIHFVGIGGIGMSGLALIMKELGFKVQGSDISNNKNIERVKQKKIKIYIGHKRQNINKSTILVISSAIKANNPELKAAQEAKLAIWHRSDLLATLIKQQPSIAVAGTHGKTTTSTFITTLLAVTEEDPTAVIGGLVPYYKSNGHSGQGRLLVAEADESDGSLVKFYQISFHCLR